MAVGNGKEAWAWALVTVDREREDEAVRLLYEMAVRQHFAGRWYIKRINVVEPMKEFPPHSPFSMFVGIKAQDEDTLIGAFRFFVETMHQRGFSHVEGHRVRIQPFSANW